MKIMTNTLLTLGAMALVVLVVFPDDVLKEALTPDGLFFGMMGMVACLAIGLVLKEEAPRQKPSLSETGA